MTEIRQPLESKKLISPSQMMRTLGGRSLPRGMVPVPPHSPTLAAGTGPVSLTDLGESAARILIARQWANERAGDLLAACKGLKECQIPGLRQGYVTARRSEWPDNMPESADEFGNPVESLAALLNVVLRGELPKRLGDDGNERVQDR